MMLLPRRCRITNIVVIMFFIGVRLIPWLLERIAQTRSRELFILAILAITLGVAMGARIVQPSWWGGILCVASLSVGLLLLSFATVFRPSERVNYSLFKYASVYMLASMILLSF